MTDKSKQHKKGHAIKDDSFDLRSIVGYELNESWDAARKNTQHRPGKH